MLARKYFLCNIEVHPLRTCFSSHQVPHNLQTDAFQNGHICLTTSYQVTSYQIRQLIMSLLLVDTLLPQLTNSSYH